MSKVVVNYAQLENAHKKMVDIAASIDEQLDTLRAGLQQLEWDGHDREAYQAHQKAWDNAVQDMNRLLNQIGGAVGVARENYLSTEMGNARAWGN